MRPSGLIIVFLVCGCAADARRGAPVEYVAGEPTAVIGRDDEVPGHDLHRTAGALLDGAGRLIVADGGSTEIRVFAPDGTLLTRYGGHGSGPSELQSISGMWIVSDTLLVYDGVLSKLVRWTVGGGFLGSEDLRLRPRSRVLDVPHGRIIAVEPLDLEPPPAGNVWQDSVVLVERNADGSLVHQYARLPGEVMYAVSLPQLGGRTMYSRLPFAPGGLFSASKGVVVFGDAEHGLVVRWIGQHAPASEVAVQLTARPLTSAMKERWLEERQAQAPAEERPGLRKFFEAWPLPERLPHFDRMILGDEGAVWLREALAPTDSTVRWSKITAEGAVTIVLKLPHNSDVLSLTTSGVILLARDADGRGNSRSSCTFAAGRAVGAAESPTALNCGVKQRALRALAAGLEVVI